MSPKFKISFLRSFLIYIFILFIPFLVQSQSNKRPKIGLALSGGGAKGLAHIGVLHAMDSLNVKPDYITGTSMGSIMGALYSIGYSANEIDSILGNTDLGAILNDDIPLKDIEMNEKHDYKRYLVTFNFSGNLIPKLPTGIVYGQHISEFFSRLSWRVADVKDFNDFEVEFKCVAADLISGKPRFFDSGDLATALRSSMSIPTVFSPVVLDTLVLVDGGVYRNFPVIEVKEMGAEKIIGSYTSFKEEVTLKEMESLTNILMRTNIFSVIQDINVQEKLCDVVVEYDLHGLGIKDFQKARKIGDYGKESMKKSVALDTLAAWSKLLSKYPEVPGKVIPERDSILIAGIKTEGLTMVSDEYIISKSGLEIGSKISKDDMAAALNNMMGTLLFKKITYTLEKDELNKDKDSFIVTFNIIEKARGQLQASLNYETFYGASLLANISVRNLLISGSRTQLRTNFSRNPIVKFGYDSYFGKNKKLQTSIKVNYELLNMKAFFNVEGVGDLNIGSQIFTSSEFMTKFAYNFNNNNQMGLDFVYQVATRKYKDGADIATEVSKIYDDGIYSQLYYFHDNVNRQFYPTKGSKIYASLKGGIPLNRRIKYLVTSDREVESELSYLNFLQFELRYRHFVDLGEIFSFSPQVSLGYSTTEVALMNSYFLGGNSRQKRIHNINFIGDEPYSLLTDSFLKFDMNFQFQIINNLFVSLITDAVIYDLHSEKYEEKVNIAAGLSVGYKSPFGPIDAGLHINRYGENIFHINIGFPF